MPQALESIYLIQFWSWVNSLSPNISPFPIYLLTPFPYLPEEDKWSLAPSFSGREARCGSLPELRPRGVVGGQRQDGGGTLLRPPRLRLLRLQGAVGAGLLVT